MKWIIKCPAPGGYSQRNWGDLHFARSLARQLEAKDQQVELQNRPEWDTGEDDADVVLLLRGKFAYTPRNRDAVNIMWVLSHPADVSFEELERYDLDLIASQSYAERLQHKFGPERVLPLLQCTDTRESDNTVLLPADQRRDVVFVGGSRNVERWCILEHVRAGLPLKVWGTGWEPWPEIMERVVGKHVENARIGALYGASRATLNDHWPDMSSYGFINNRVFDALACGLPIISDHLPELEAMFGDSICYYRPNTPLAPVFAQFELDYPRYFDRVQSLAKRVARKHSFAARTGFLLSAVQRLRQRRSGTGWQALLSRLRTR